MLAAAHAIAVERASTQQEKEVPPVSHAVLEALETAAKHAPQDGNVLQMMLISQHAKSVNKEKQPRGRVQQVVATVILVSMEVLQEFVRNVLSVNTRISVLHCHVSHAKKVKFQTTKVLAANDLLIK